MQRETDALRAFRDGLSTGSSDGRLFVASSAGGVHGAGTPEVVTERSAPSPRSAYGEGKLTLEAEVESWARASGVSVLVGRISNLYGPGQDLAKAQGFVSHVCRNALRNEPTTLRVPLETTRDFLHVDDAAARIAAWLDEEHGAADGTTLKLLVSGVSMTLARTVALVRSVTRRRTLLVHVADPRAHEQPRYLRYRSVVGTELDRRHVARPLEVGILDVFESLRRERARGAL